MNVLLKEIFDNWIVQVLIVLKLRIVRPNFC